MSGPDRRHAVGVARETARILDSTAASAATVAPAEIGAPPREVMAAALLHDVGKVESGIGTFSRVGVTLMAMALGRDRIVAAGSDPSQRWRWAQRAGLYLSHDTLGEAMLARAGSDEVTSTWAGEHHLDPRRWTIDRRFGDALKAADGD